MGRGYLLLEGGAEFGGSMAEPDRRAIDLAGGPLASIAILPTAAAPDGNDENAGGNGVRWFQSLGAMQVVLLPLVDRASAEDVVISGALSVSRLVYLLGGFPGYLGRTLSGSRSWRAVLEAYQKGAVVGGSSAGAMLLCQHYYDPETRSVAEGLNLLPGTCVIPHHDTFGKGWAAQLEELIPGVTLIGIDEGTGMIDDGPQGAWNVYGRGAVTLYRGGQAFTCTPGQPFHL